jgi:hypothetical protein
LEGGPGKRVRCRECDGRRDLPPIVSLFISERPYFPHFIQALIEHLLRDATRMLLIVLFVNLELRDVLNHFTNISASAGEHVKNDQGIRQEKEGKSRETPEQRRVFRNSRPLESKTEKKDQVFYIEISTLGRQTPTKFRTSLRLLAPWPSRN